MAIDQLLHGTAERRQVERRPDPRRIADVVRRALRVHLVEEPQPALAVREREDRGGLLGLLLEQSRQQPALLVERQARQRLRCDGHACRVSAERHSRDHDHGLSRPAVRPAGHRPGRRRGPRCGRAAPSAPPPAGAGRGRCVRWPTRSPCRCGRLRATGPCRPSRAARRGAPASPETLGLRISSTIGRSTCSSPSSQFRSSTAMSESMPSCSSGLSPSSRSGDVPSTRASLSRSSVPSSPGRSSGSAARMASRPGKVPSTSRSRPASAWPQQVGEPRRDPARHAQAAPARPLDAHHADLDVLPLHGLLEQRQRLRGR